MRTGSTDRPRRSFANLGLTERQVDVLALMMQGKSNKAICRVLHLAEPTVKKHVTAILTALQVTNRTEAVIAIGQLGSKLPIVGETVRNRRNRTSDSPAEPDASNSGGAGVVQPPFSLPDKPSVVVLPFTNLSRDPSQEYFADGMMEDITVALGRVSSLFVVGSNSAFTYKGRSVEVKQIGAELGIRYAVTGSVRRENDRVRITVQLIDAAQGSQVWADRFEGELDHVFEIQDRVANQVSAMIAPALRSAEIKRAQRKPTENLTAYDLFLRALSRYSASLAEGEEALRLLHKAINLDPSYGAAYALAAYCYRTQKLFSWISPTDPKLAEGARLAWLAAEKSDNDPEALWMAGYSLPHLAGELDQGLALVERSISLNPNSAGAWFARGMICAFLGDTETAIKHLACARRLNPLDTLHHNHWSGTAFAHFVAGRYEEASAAASKSLHQRPTFPPALRMKAVTHALVGRIDEARDYVQRVLALYPNATVSEARAFLEAPLRRNPQPLARYLEGLRLAGLPEGEGLGVP